MAKVLSRMPIDRRWELPETAVAGMGSPISIPIPIGPKALAGSINRLPKGMAGKDGCEVNACIAKSSEGEELVDQPEVDRKRTRVSGPFTVEAVQPAEESLDLNSPLSRGQGSSPIGGEPE